MSSNVIKFIQDGVEVNPYSFKGVGAIYKIINSCNQKFYLGRASDLYNRITVHLSDLRRGVNHHKKSPLGHAWKKYGEESFYVEILEVAKELNLKALEQIYLDDLKPWIYGYNQDKKSTGFTSESAKAEMERQKANGRSWAGVNNGNSKLSKESALEIRKLYLSGKSTKEIAKSKSLTVTTVLDVLSGKRWLSEDVRREKRLTSEQREEAVRLYLTGLYSYSDIAKKFNCSKSSVGRAVRGDYKNT